MAIEIVDLPINSMVIFHSYVSLPEVTMVFVGDISNQLMGFFYPFITEKKTLAHGVDFCFSYDEQCCITCSILFGDVQHALAFLILHLFQMPLATLAFRFWKRPTFLICIWRHSFGDID